MHTKVIDLARWPNNRKSIWLKFNDQEIINNKAMKAKRVNSTNIKINEYDNSISLKRFHIKDMNYNEI